MAPISEKAKEDLLRLAKSESLRRDMERLRATRHNPVLVNGKVDIDRLLEFLTQYNEFINHQPKPFRKIIDRVMKL